MRRLIKINILILLCIMIFNLCATKAYAQDSYRAKIYIDTSDGDINCYVNESIKVEGWIMSNDKNSKLKVFLNGEEQTTINIIRKDREDVIRAITDFGTYEQNPQPGFEFKIDTTNMEEGSYKLEIKVLSENGEELTNIERKINLKKYIAKTYIDMPNSSDKYCIKDELEVEGWAMSNYENYKIETYIDGKKQEIKKIDRLQRPDVIKAIHGYGTVEQNQTPGYILKIDTSKIKSGSYNLQIKIVSCEGKILDEVNKTVEIQRYTSRMYIDSPVDNKIVKPEFAIIGWVMTDDEQSELNVYIDGIKQNIKQIIRIERPDVIKAIQGYGGIEKNPKPGFELKIDTSQISYGTHVLTIKNVSIEGLEISNTTSTFNYENYKAKTYIDNPADGTITKYEENIKVKGWAMSETENISIKAYIDGKEQEIKELVRTERSDVIDAIHGYGTISQNPTPGYEFLIDVKQIEDGQHTLKLEICDIKGDVLETTERKIAINKYKARGYIDNPVPLGQARNILYIRGWIMTNDTNSTVKMYIDGKEQDISSLIRIEREDVIRAIDGYGGIGANPRPGYKVEIDISKFLDGEHELTVEAISNEEKVMYNESQSFIVYNNYGFGIDVSKHNGTINWNKVKESGVNFAMIRAGYRGYGQPGNLAVDSKFLTNMNGAISNGIEVGVYFFSQAVTVEEAIEEADMTIELIRENGFSDKITYPIVIDTEDVDNAEGRADGLSKNIRTMIVQIFCERIKQYGYKPMIYANKYWLNNQLDMNKLSMYDVWLAHYTNTEKPIENPSDYTGKYDIWQYTDKGTIYGISGNVDLNIGYKKYI